MNSSLPSNTTSPAPVSTNQTSQNGKKRKSPSQLALFHKRIRQNLITCPVAISILRDWKKRLWRVSSVRGPGGQILKKMWKLMAVCGRWGMEFAVAMKSLRFGQINMWFLRRAESFQSFWLKWRLRKVWWRRRFVN